jgi:two-component system chemotaxis response regulator CheB
MGHIEQHRAIAIGGSTGALPAIHELLQNLPRELAGPVFVALHVGSEGRNMLAQILDSRTDLTVKTAEDSEQAVAGTVYVAPTDHHLLVIDRNVRLGRGPRENLARPAIDPLFRSIGACYGGGGIAVLLSGKLNDGAAGLADLKRCGGTTVVQSPTDAVAPDMPLGALEASDIDHRAPASQLGKLLLELLGQSSAPSPLVPRSVSLEIDIALGRPCLTRDIEQFADPVALSCPSCGGVLSQVRTKPLRFRCQVGHGFTADVLAQEQEETLDEAVRVALRIVEERAQLVDRLAHESDTAGRVHSARDFQRKAKELRGQAEVLRRAALLSAEKVYP